jgi:hypothetical protein
MVLLQDATEPKRIPRLSDWGGRARIGPRPRIAATYPRELQRVDRSAVATGQRWGLGVGDSIHTCSPPDTPELNLTNDDFRSKFNLGTLIPYIHSEQSTTTEQLGRKACHRTSGRCRTPVAPGANQRLLLPYRASRRTPPRHEQSPIPRRWESPAPRSVNSLSKSL